MLNRVVVALASGRLPENNVPRGMMKIGALRQAWAGCTEQVRAFVLASGDRTAKIFLMSTAAETKLPSA
ncbi:MAG: hypothetical protein WA117_14710 [Verrucomicrobiia bacterium]